MRDRLHLISWNIHGIPTQLGCGPSGRMDRIATEIDRRKPDLVLLQEVWCRRTLDRLVAALGSRFDRVSGPGGGGLLRRSGLAAFVRRASGWKVENQEFHEFEHHANAWKIWEGDGVSGKGVQVLQLERKGSNTTVLNTHLQAEYAGTDYLDIRVGQIRQLTRAAASNSATGPVFAAGDFNSDPAADTAYTELGRHWDDLTAPARQVCGCSTHFHSDGSAGGWIDYVFAKRDPRWEVTGVLDMIRNETADIPWSDHNGLDMRLQWRSRSRLSVISVGGCLLSQQSVSTRRKFIRTAVLGYPGLILLD
jgi:endonuclease/exonuclease/phosphatase family metal-dependent hydrolase